MRCGDSMERAISFGSSSHPPSYPQYCQFAAPRRAFPPGDDRSASNARTRALRSAPLQRRRLARSGASVSETGYADVLAEQAALCTRLMGVPLPVTAAQLTDSIDRLRRGLNYRPAAAEVLARLARNYSLDFLRDPWLAVNLLNPSWWPQRIRGVWRLVRGRRR